VEAAFITPVVVLLLFGIIEYAFYFMDAVAADSTVKAGVRQASASPRKSTFAQDAVDHMAAIGGGLNKAEIADLWVYKVGPTGTTPIGHADFSDCTTCVKFRWDAATNGFAELSNTWPASSQVACAAGTTGGPPDRIGLYLRVEHEALTGLVFDTITIRKASVMSLEPIPRTAGCS
jgi:hypothetical protein